MGMLYSAKDGRAVSRRRLGTSSVLLVFASMVRGQQPVPATAPPSPPVTQSGQSVDIIPLRAYVGGTPLQHGNIVVGSEKITLNGRALRSGDDYAMDYAAGVVYLKVTQNMGDSMVVAYSYDNKATATNQAAQFNGFNVNLLPGAKLLMGFGLADRDSAGQVVSSNVFGWNNNLKFGGGSVSGLMLMANQQAAGVKTGFGQSGSPGSLGMASSTQGNQSHFVLQSYKSKFLGGAVNFDVQDISKDFANFSAVSAAGYADTDVNRLKAEKGLERTGLNVAGLKFGQMSLDDTMKSVKDQNGSSINWKSFGLAQGGFKVNFNSQKVDDGFGRFNDLAEAEKAQLAKERGMSRESFAGEFQSKSGKFNFVNQGISDDVTKRGIKHQDLSFDSARYKFDYGDEKVDPNFLRSGSLTSAETAQFSREIGMKRSWFSFSAAPDGKSGPFTFGQASLVSPTGKFDEMDAAYTGKHWSLQHISVGGSPGFASMSALQDDFVNSDIKKIGAAFGNSAAPVAGDKTAFMASPTLKRDYTFLSSDFAKKWIANYDSLTLQGKKGSGYATDASITNGSLVASFHRQEFGNSLTEAASLMPMEQARLGVLPGLRKSDFSFADQISKSAKISISNMNADLTSGSADRTTIDYVSKGFALTAAQRKVDTGFAPSSPIVDPDAAVLSSLKGFDQRGIKFAFNKLPNFTLTGDAQDQRDQLTGEYRDIANYKLVWNASKTTQFTMIDNRTQDRINSSEILRTEMQQMSLAQDFGKYGKFAFLDEMDIDDGTKASLPSSHKDYLSYEAKLSSGTSFRAEQTIVKFADGTNQGISAETISTALTKRMGVSFTEAQVSGDSKAQQPGKNNCGVWYDLGKGVRISYGYAHQYQDGTGTAQNGLTIGTAKTDPAPNQLSTLAPGTFGPVNFAGGFNSVSYDSTPGKNHTQSFNNVALSTVKPLNLGPFTNLKLNLGVDSASDYATFSKNNEAASVSGQLGSNTFGYEYKGQLATKGIEGIDRSFKLQTSQSPKALLQLNLNYKLRTLPGNVDYVIRDYSIVAKPIKNFDITNQLQTNPEVANTSVFLGSVPQAARSDKWLINYHQSTDTTLGATYQELINTSNKLRTTTGGFTLKLFQKSGSPLSLFFGQEDTIGGGIPHRLTSRYSAEFDQKPGPFQTLSFFVGNLSYDYSKPLDSTRENWTARVNYQLKF